MIACVLPGRTGKDKAHELPVTLHFVVRQDPRHKNHASPWKACYQKLKPGLLMARKTSKSVALKNKAVGHWQLLASPLAPAGQCTMPHQPQAQLSTTTAVRSFHTGYHATRADSQTIYWSATRKKNLSTPTNGRRTSSERYNREVWTRPNNSNVTAIWGGALSSARSLLWRDKTESLLTPGLDPMGIQWGVPNNTTNPDHRAHTHPTSTRRLARSHALPRRPPTGWTSRGR